MRLADHTPRRSVLLCLALVVTAACTDREEPPPAAAAAGVATDTAAVRQAIDSTGDRMTAAVLRGDADGVVESLADDYLSLEAPGQIMRGRAAYRTFLDEMAKAGTWSDMSYQSQGVDVSGDIAVDYGHFRVTYVPTGGDTTRFNGNYMHVWRRQPDGSWRLSREIANSAPPPVTGAGSGGSE